MLRGLATKPVHDDLLQSRLSQKDRLWSGKPARKYVELPHGLFDRPCSSLRRDSGVCRSSGRRSRQTRKASLSVAVCLLHLRGGLRSEEPTSELQSLMRISSAVFRLKKHKLKK